MSYRLNDPDGSRTTEEAIHNIKSRTLKEHIVQLVILVDLKQRHTESVTITDYGIDNSGNFISDEKLISAKPDWLIQVGDKAFPTEVCVHSEKFNIVSFKSVKLERLCRNSNNRIFVIRENYYLSFDSNCASKILDCIPVQTIPKIYGGKPSIILDMTVINYMINNGNIKKLNYFDESLRLMNSLSWIFA